MGLIIERTSKVGGQMTTWNYDDWCFRNNYSKEVAESAKKYEASVLIVKMDRL